MSITSDSIFVSFITLAASFALLFFAYRGFRASRNPGFLVLALALVLIPWVMNLVDGPLAEWVQARGWSARRYGLIALAQHSLSMTLLAWSLVLLARPLHRGRRA